VFETVLADIRYALRWLRRSPGFTLIAVASLAIGIGFNTALFTIVDAVLFRPLPVDHPDRLVDVFTTTREGDTYATSSYPDYLDLSARNDVFTGLLGFSLSLDAMKLGAGSRPALGEIVTGNYFQLLGVTPLLGRTLLPEDDRAGAPRVSCRIGGGRALRRESGRSDRLERQPRDRVHGQRAVERFARAAGSPRRPSVALRSE
jgi:putative ABC transport system permease protein